MRGLVAEGALVTKAEEVEGQDGFQRLERLGQVEEPTEHLGTDRLRR